MSLGLLPVLLGLLSAISWGAGDFSGGLAARRSGVFSVVLASQAAGGLLLVGLARLFGEAFPPLAQLAWGALAGTVGSVGLLALYRGLATGRMGVVAPTSAVLGAALPVLVSAVVEGLPGAAQLAGFGLALMGVWLLARPDPPAAGAGGAAPFSLNHLALPLLAGLGFGLFFVFIDRASESAVFWPLVAARVGSLSLLGLAALAARQPLVPAPARLPLIILAGALDAGGNACFALAAQTGRLDVAAVISSLYPASTVLLAWRLLKERLTRSQMAGVLTALAAIVLITL